MHAIESRSYTGAHESRQLAAVEIQETFLKRTTTVSRRTVLGAGACALTATMAIPSVRSAGTGLNAKSEDAIRKYYAAWENDDKRPFDALLTDDFTFTSANDDDHIGKSAFKVRCWESQKAFIERFDLQRLFGRDNVAFVMYLGRTKNGKTFRNVEYLRLRDGKVRSIECYFGAQSSFPSAVSAKPGDRRGRQT